MGMPELLFLIGALIFLVPVILLIAILRVVSKRDKERAATDLQFAGQSSIAAGAAVGNPPFVQPPPMQPPSPPGWWARNWKWFAPVGCLTLIALVAAFVACFILLVLGSMKSTDGYKLALQKAQNDPRVQQRLGTPIEDGLFVSGSVKVSGSSGKADLTIPISGPKGKGTIYVDATKFAGEWKFNRLEVGFDGGGEPKTVDLLAPVEAPRDH
jgi:hypothetical protein